MIITLAMWIHVVLNALVCYEPTDNPIWGELRVAFVVVMTAALWVTLAAVSEPTTIL